MQKHIINGHERRELAAVLFISVFGRLIVVNLNNFKRSIMYSVLVTLSLQTAYLI